MISERYKYDEVAKITYLTRHSQVNGVIESYQMEEYRKAKNTSITINKKYQIRTAELCMRLQTVQCVKPVLIRAGQTNTETEKSPQMT